MYRRQYFKKPVKLINGNIRYKYSLYMPKSKFAKGINLSRKKSLVIGKRKFYAL